VSTTLDALAKEFWELRPRLLAVAYRITGSVADAEDAVQESWLRLSELTDSQRAEIRDRTAWLITVVGRIGLDRVRSAAARKERYVGPWLPEPIVTPFGGSAGDDPLEAAVRDEELRMAAMVVLDKLPPEQRVAFVLHDAFSLPFHEIAELLDCTPATARQYASRARRVVTDSPPPPRASLAEQQELLDRLLAAVGSGDMRAVAEMLDPDVVLIGDGGGKARTARRIMLGADKIVRFLSGLLRMYRPGALAGGRPVLVNGDVGIYLPAAPGGDGYPALDTHVQAMSLRDGRIVAFYDIANPDKLTRVSGRFDC
jgi:RNA polymerase sigma-70 factor (ECF subfamily)